MKFSHVFFAGILALAIPPVSYAQDPTTVWIVKLGSLNYAEREKAARALEQLGADALPILDKVLAKGDLETKRRAASIVERIEERLLREALLQATPLRLRLRDTPVHEAPQEIEKQTGLRCGAKSAQDRKINLDTGSVPFWQAWQQFCAAARLEESDYVPAAAKLKRMSESEVQTLLAMLELNETDPVVRFIAPRLELEHAAEPGGYAVDDRHSIRVRVKWTATEPLGDEKKTHAIFAVELRAEPRLDIVAAPRVEITKIVDAQGKEQSVQAMKMLPDAFANLGSADFLASYIGEVQYGGLLHFRALPWPNPPSTLKELHGVVRVQIRVRPRRMEIENVLRAAGKEIRGKHGITLKILEAETTDEGDLHLRLRLEDIDSLTPKTPDQQVMRVRTGVVVYRGAIDVALERLQLLDGKKQKFVQESARHRQTKDDKGYEVEMLFASGGKNLAEAALVLTEEPRIVNLQMPFMVRSVSPPARPQAK